MKLFYLETDGKSFRAYSQEFLTTFVQSYRSFHYRVGRFFRTEKALYFVGPSGAIDKFSAGALPAPLHLAGAFARLSYLGWRDKLALGRGLRSLARGIRPDERGLPFSEWLIRHGQTPAAIARFWHVVLVSALSESLDRIDVEHARKVFADTFLANRDGWLVDIPTVPLEELYGGRLTDWLTSRGSEIRLQATVEGLELEGDRVTAVRLGSALFNRALAHSAPSAETGGLAAPPIRKLPPWKCRGNGTAPHRSGPAAHG